MEKTRHSPWTRWQAVLAYVTAAALVFLATLVAVDLKARSLVIYQPEPIAQQR